MSRTTPWRHRAAIVWLAGFVFIMVAFRVFCGARIGVLGVVDELGFLAGGAFLFGIGTLISPRLRFACLALAGSLVCALYAAAVCYFLFFRAYLQLGAIKQAVLLDEVASSVYELLTLPVVALFLIVPMAAFMTAAVWARRITVRPASLTQVLLLVAISVPTTAVDSLRSDSFVIAEHNVIMHLVRASVKDAYFARRRERRVALADVAISYPATYNSGLDEQFRSAESTDYPLLALPVKETERGAARLNVVLVVVESLRMFETGFSRSRASATPTLDRLAREGLAFDTIYANGNRTVRGELALLCSALPLTGGGEVYSAHPDLSIACLPKILRDHGYQTHWLSGLDAQFAGGREFLSRHGIDHFHDEASITALRGEPSQAGIGAADEDLFALALHVLDDAAQPFFAEILTVANHHPWDHVDPSVAPEHALDGARGIYRRYRASTYHSDTTIAAFLGEARERGWFADTVFVFTGDHGTWVFPESDADHRLDEITRTEIFFRTPLILWSPAHLAPRRMSTLGSQIDFAPTLLSILGIRGPNSFQGTDLLAPVPRARRFAIAVNENSWNLRRHDAYCYSLGVTCFRNQAPKCAKGVEPSFAGHTCFRTGADLLSTRRGDLHVEILADEAAQSMLEHGRRLVENNRLLMSLDAFYPRRIPPSP